MSAPTVARRTGGYVRPQCAFPDCTTQYWNRGYCRHHHAYMTKNGIPFNTYAEQAPTKWTNDELMAEWDFMRGWVAWEHFGPRVGIKQESWERAYTRARAAGDPRARRARNDPAGWGDPCKGVAA